MVQGRNAVCLPLREDPAEATRLVTLEVLHRLEFDAEFLMSGVIVRAAGAKQEESQIYLKGSVHSVVQLVAHNRLPENWAHVSTYPSGLKLVVQSVVWLDAQELGPHKWFVLHAYLKGLVAC